MRYAIALFDAYPALPGFGREPKTYAAWPVWSDSTTKEISFQPHAEEGRDAAMAPRARLRPADAAQGSPRRSRGPRRVAGAARADLRLPELPKRAARSVLCGDRAQGERVRAHGCQRRSSGCASSASSIGCGAAPRSWRDGRFVLEQETNAYAVLPASQWRGYKEPPEPPPPAPGTWGDHPPLPSQIELRRPPSGARAAACGR